MSQKRRGLGRGLGALIPSAPEGERPVDVFFPSGPKSEASRLGSTLTVVPAPEETSEDAASADSATKGSTRARSWDSAIADGRLKIRTGSVESAVEVDDASAVDQALLSPPAPVSEDGDEDDFRAGSLGASLGLVSSIEITEPLNPDVSRGTSNGGDDVVSRETEDAAPVGESVPADGTTPSPRSEEAGAGDVSRETGDDLLPVPGATFAEIPVDAIRPNNWQPRTVFDEGELDELVDSIREIGVLQPIVVRPDKAEAGVYELIMGERRWRASKEAGLETIPAIIRSTDDSDMLRDALLENLHRAALNPLEEAAAYRQLLDDFGCTHEELASRIARSRPQISNTLRLLKLPPLVQRRVAAGVLSAGHARALLGLSDGAEIERLAQRIVSEGLSVRATEEIVTLMAEGGDKPKRRTPRPGQRSEAIDELASRLSDRFETRVKVSVGKTKGRMTVEFASVEDLNRILAVMAPEDPGILRN
jgi:ParB family chromosome partitioning protein